MTMLGCICVCGMCDYLCISVSNDIVVHERIALGDGTEHVVKEEVRRRWMMCWYIVRRWMMEGTL